MENTTTAPQRVIKWTLDDYEHHEEMEVEFRGGPYDGTRVFLCVVREGEQRLEAGDQMRVLEMRYNRLPNGQKPQVPA